MLLGEIGDWATLPEVVRTGTPVVEATFDMPENPFWEELAPAIAPFAAPVAMIAAERLHLADAGEISILDVGGGSGIYLGHLARAQPGRSLDTTRLGPRQRHRPPARDRARHR